MSVASQNLFAYLADEGDDSPAPLPAPKGPAPAPVPAPTPAAAASKPSAPRAQRGDYPNRGGARRVYQSDREINPDAAAPVENGKETRGAHFEGNNQQGRGRGGGQGRGRGRGGRGSSNPRSNSGTYLGGDRPRREKGGPRALDKHSQTGIKESDKQQEQAWGSNEGEKELQAEVEGEEDAKKEAAPEGAETPAPKTPVAAEPEEEDNTQTYDQYLAAQAAKKLSIALPEARSANEGVDDSQWKSGVALLKKGEAEEESWGGLKKADKARVRKEKETKTFLEVDFVSKPPRREPREDRGRGRGGPRGGRGGRGRGGAGAGSENRPPRSTQQSVNLDDAAAFPSLG